MRSMIRQGDVLVRPSRRKLRGRPVAAEDNRLIIARGEQTGHHHSFAAWDRVALFREDGRGAGLYLAVTGDQPVLLDHQEHTALPVEQGVHEVVLQRVYDGTDPENTPLPVQFSD